MHPEKPVSISLCKGNGEIQHLIWPRSENIYKQPVQRECLLTGERQTRGVNEWEKTSSLEKRTVRCAVFNPVSQGGRAWGAGREFSARCRRLILSSKGTPKVSCRPGYAFLYCLLAKFLSSSQTRGRIKSSFRFCQHFPQALKSVTSFWSL